MKSCHFLHTIDIAKSNCYTHDVLIAFFIWKSKYVYFLREFDIDYVELVMSNYLCYFWLIFFFGMYIYVSV